MSSSHPAIVLLLLAALAVVPWSLAGCSNQACVKVKQGYEQALQQEGQAQLQQVEADAAAVAPAPAAAAGQAVAGAKAPVHVGVAIRYELLNEIIGRTTQALLTTGLQVAKSQLKLDAMKIDFSVTGKPLDLEVTAADACDHCFRITGKLGGGLKINSPILQNSIPLRGEFSFVAPVQLQPDPEGGARLMLDLAEVARYTKGAIIEPELKQLPPAITRVVELPLTRALTEQLMASLEPVELFDYRGPDLGVEGLEIVPATLRSDAASKTLFVGFATNLPGMDDAMEPVAALEQGESLALSVHPQMVLHALRILMNKGKVPRSYTLQGEASPQGTANVVLTSLRTGAVGGGQAEGLALGFKGFNVADGGPCFWFDAVARMRAAIRDGKVVVEVQEVNFTNSSLPGVVQQFGNWASAAFIEEGVRLVDQSLRVPRLEVPGVEAALDLGALEVTPERLVVRGGMTIAD